MLLLGAIFNSFLFTRPSVGAASKTVSWDPKRINELGWTDAHMVAYGWPIRTADGDEIFISPESHQMTSFLSDATNEFLCLQNDFGQTALHLAVRQDYRELVSFLVLARKVPCLDVGNRDGDTPLHYAAAWGRAESAEVLLQGGADMKLRNHHGNTPMDDALTFGHQDVYSLMEAAHKVIEKEL